MGSLLCIGLGLPVWSASGCVRNGWRRLTPTHPPARLPARPPVRPHRVPGGSAANVIKGLAGLSSGRRPTAMVGMLGRDAAGAEYKKKLQSQVGGSAGVEARDACMSNK